MLKKFTAVLMAVVLMFTMSVSALAQNTNAISHNKILTEQQVIEHSNGDILVEKTFYDDNTVTMTMTNGDSQIIMRGHKISSLRAWEERFEYDTVTFETSTTDIYSQAALASAIAALIPGPHSVAAAAAAVIFGVLSDDDKRVYFVTDVTVTEVRIGGSFLKYEIYKEIHAYKDAWYDNEIDGSPWYSSYDSTDPY